MNKLVAVSAAVANQLHHEGKWPPNDLSKVFGSDYGYDRFSMGIFLKAVRWHLLNGTPPYTFNFDEEFVDWAVAHNVGDVISGVNDRTV